MARISNVSAALTSVPPPNNLNLPPISDGYTSRTISTSRSHRHLKRGSIASSSKRYESEVLKSMSLIDRGTFLNIYHVSEYCQAIQLSMLEHEKTWQTNPSYMNS